MPGLTSPSKLGLKQGRLHSRLGAGLTSHRPVTRLQDPCVTGECLFTPPILRVLRGQLEQGQSPAGTGDGGFRHPLEQVLRLLVPPRFLQAEGLAVARRLADRGIGGLLRGERKVTCRTGGIPPFLLDLPEAE